MGENSNAINMKESNFVSFSGAKRMNELNSVYY